MTGCRNKGMIAGLALKFRPRTGLSRIICLSILLGLVCISASARCAKAAAQDTVTAVAAKNSNSKSADLTPTQFIKLIRLTQVGTGDGAAAASIDLSTFTKRQYLAFYLMYRAVENGWFTPLESTFGLSAPPCPTMSLRLQSTFKVSLNRPVWCEKSNTRQPPGYSILLTTRRTSMPDYFRIFSHSRILPEPICLLLKSCRQLRVILTRSHPTVW